MRTWRVQAGAQEGEGSLEILRSRERTAQCMRDAVRYVWVGLPTFLGLFIGTTFARAP